jgi:hypothetical protein
MGSGKRWDLARQTANVFGALFQVGVTFAASATIQEVVDSALTLWSNRRYTRSLYGL